MNEGAGTSVGDSSTNSNHGSITTDAFWTTESNQSYNDLALITATDEAGNTSNKVVTLAIRDTITPTLNCLADTAISVQAQCYYTIPDFLPFIYVK